MIFSKSGQQTITRREKKGVLYATNIFGGLQLRLIACALVVAISAPVTAGTAARESLAAGQMLRGRFVQDRQLAGFAKPLTSEGTFLLVPGTGLIWRGEKPFANTTVITDAGILQIANGKEAMRLPTSRLPGLRHLYDVLGASLSGNVGPLRQNFAVSQTDIAAHWQIELTPLPGADETTAQLKSLTLTGGRFVDTVEIDKEGGDVDRIHFLDQAISPEALSAEEKRLFETMGP